MLTRHIHHGLVYYTSPLLRGCKVPHAFSTLIADVRSTRAQDRDFGLGSASDHPHPLLQAQLDANYDRLAEPAGLGHRLRLFVKQVHGASALSFPVSSSATVSTTIAPATTNRELGDADAIVTTDPRTYACVRGADCATILISDRTGKFVAAAHAGWRGTLANVAGAAVARLRAAGATSELVAAIGPCISFEAFEVGQEVAAAFADDPCARGQIGLHPRTGKHHLNLRQILARQLAVSGVAAVDVAEGCTVYSRLPDGSALFSSHRREAACARRLAAIIGPIA